MIFSNSDSTIITLLPRLGDILSNNHPGADDRVRIVGVIDDLLKPVMRHDNQAIHSRNPYPLAVGQTESSANGLLHQGSGVRGPQGDDSIEIRHVPSLFEHIDVDDDFDRVVRVSQRSATARRPRLSPRRARSSGRLSPCPCIGPRRNRRSP